MITTKHKQVILEFAYDKTSFKGEDLTPSSLNNQMNQSQLSDAFYLVIKDGYIDKPQFGGLVYHISRDGGIFYEDGGYIEQERIKMDSNEEKKKEKRNQRIFNLVSIIIAIIALIVAIFKD